MTLQEIHRQAEERYKVPKTACRAERLAMAHLKQRFIDKMVKEHVHEKTPSENI